MKKRVLFVIMSLENGGAEKSLVNLLNELPAEVYDIDLLLFRRTGIFLKQVPEHVHFIGYSRILEALYGKIDLRAIKNYPLYVLKYAVWLAAQVGERAGNARRAWRWKQVYRRIIPSLEGDYDAALAYLEGDASYFVMDRVPGARRKILWIHNDYRQSNFPKKYDRTYFERADGLVSISKACVDILKEEFPECSDKIFCVENITSSQVIRKRGKEFSPKEYQEGCFKILSVGRLELQKGFDLAIKAASILKARGLQFVWYVVGEGSLRAALERQIKEEGVEDCFFLLGIRENPYPYMAGADILAQTSRYEGKSVVIDEAKILGLPMVVTNYPTAGDQLKDGEGGLIVDICPVGIADGIMRCAKDRSLLDGLKGFLLEHEYGNQDEVHKYMDLIDG